MSELGVQDCCCCCCCCRRRCPRALVARSLVDVVPVLALLDSEPVARCRRPRRCCRGGGGGGSAGGIQKTVDGNDAAHVCVCVLMGSSFCIARNFFRSLACIRRYCILLPPSQRPGGGGGGSSSNAPRRSPHRAFVRMRGCMYVCFLFWFAVHRQTVQIDESTDLPIDRSIKKYAAFARALTRTRCIVSCHACMRRMAKRSSISRSGAERAAAHKQLLRRHLMMI